MLCLTTGTSNGEAFRCSSTSSRSVGQSRGIRTRPVIRPCSYPRPLAVSGGHNPQKTKIMTNILYIFTLTGLLACNISTDNNNQSDTLITNQQTTSMDIDIIDAYKLTIGKTFLFGKYDAFITDIGIPTKVSIAKTEYPVSSKSDLDNIIAKAKNPDIVTLHYNGIDMWYGYDNIIIPFTVDFRTTNKTIIYGATNFDKSYTVEDFKKQFPKSGNPSSQMPSLFSMMTGKTGANFKSFNVVRKSKDDPEAQPTVEFTFDNGKLIFIMFANF